ncbi:MAG: molecular chaperone [Hyphomicrobiales bacterium]|nr:molecular chaperone [Hyphomicrobiales bacterium]
MRKLFAGTFTAFLMLGIASTSQATSLQISPVLVDVPAPGAASKLVLKNSGSGLVKAQIRVFKWIQKDGRDKLVPTRDVVASPPMVKILPDKTNLVRIIRINKSPTNGEEAYRLIVDQLPDRSRKSGIAVKLQMRYSIPVFFGASSGDEPKLAWTVKNHGSNLIVKNSGKRHVRISELSIKDKKGASIATKNGLVGYVLSNSRASFDIKPVKKAKRNSRVYITANGQLGEIKLKSKVQ